MAEEKKEMSFDDWKRLGVLAKTLRHEIMNLFTGYKKSSKEARWLRSALKGMERLRDKLDNLVFEQCSEENTNDLTNVFYGPIEEMVVRVIEFEEAGIEERTLLLAAFDYGVDDEGYVLTSSGDRIASKENTGECLKVDNTLLISGPGGELEIHDGTPTAIAAYLRKLETSD